MLNTHVDLPVQEIGRLSSVTRDCAPTLRANRPKPITAKNIDKSNRSAEAKKVSVHLIFWEFCELQLAPVLHHLEAFLSILLFGRSKPVGIVSNHSVNVATVVALHS
jgi:hypothetical protein